ncbi:hypothetical protein AMTR_s00061p00162590 [Amborella trichopoda]|uniref:Uncharacterized protein n=1 Tax=Amborella trichopoda TaxID=13333 RepID=U5D0M3_AMBTC|nr:hypothetical protein AMTR_s00061p00162590 [Amborella trichopoda]
MDELCFASVHPSPPFFIVSEVFFSIFSLYRELVSSSSTKYRLRFNQIEDCAPSKTINTKGEVSTARKLAGILNKEISGARFRQGQQSTIGETIEELVLVENTMDYEPEKPEISIKIQLGGV